MKFIVIAVLAGIMLAPPEAKELSVVYIMGTLTLAQMKDLVHSNIAYNLSALASLSR